MSTDLHPALSDPFNHYSLRLGKGYWENPLSGDKYYINGGIPVFLPEELMSGNNLKYSRFYDRISRFYRFSSLLASRFGGYSDRKSRMRYLQKLHIAPGNRVLEVAVGTADNLKYLPEGAIYSGIDISFGMLTMAAKHLRKWKRSAFLFQGEAEHLPFHADSFDVVFLVGGIVLFNDGQRALQEMIRVAKPGARLLIVDDKEDTPARGEQSNPFNPGDISSPGGAMALPSRLIPHGMKNIEISILDGGNLFCLIFTKPEMRPGHEHKPLITPAVQR